MERGADDPPRALLLPAIPDSNRCSVSLGIPGVVIAVALLGCFAPGWNSLAAGPRSALSRHLEMLTVVREGTESPGPVRVIMVGWHPPLEDLRGESERMVAVQWNVTQTSGMPPPAPAHLIRMVSLNYGRAMLWSASRDASAQAARSLRRLAQSRDAVPGRISRVYDVPVTRAAYALIRAAGVDLMGTKDLEATRRLLLCLR